MLPVKFRRHTRTYTDATSCTFLKRVYRKKRTTAAPDRGGHPVGRKKRRRYALTTAA